MSRAVHAFDAVHLALLALAAGIILTVGVTAGVAFSVSSDLTMQVTEYSAVEDPHNRLVPGLIMNTAFRVTDALVLGLVGLASVVLGATLLRMGKAFFGSPANVLRLVATAVVLILTLFQTLLFRPSLNADLDAYYELAKAGQMEEAQSRKASFDERHPKATMLLTTQLGLVLVACVLDVPALVGGRRREDGA